MMPHPIDRRAAANRPAQAFTLIEVLVVVAIIAVLVAILLPALSAARQQTRRVLCASNLHTWANAFQTYAGAFGGYIPRDYGGQQYLYVGSGDRWHVLAPEVMSPYLGGPRLPLVPRDQDPFVTKPFDQLTTNKDADDRDLFLAPIFLKMPSLQCPSFPAGTLTESLPTGRVISEQPLDYVTNGFGFAGQSGGGQGLTRIEKVPQPGRLIYVTEVNRDNDIIAFKLHDLLKPQQLWDSNEARMINDTRHPVALSSSLTIVYKKGARTVAMGSANALFFDGHAACPRIDQMRLSWFTPYAK